MLPHNGRAASMTDSLTLLRRIKDGDAGAADRLFRRYSARLRALIRAKLLPQARERIPALDRVLETVR